MEPLVKILFGFILGLISNFLFNSYKLRNFLMCEFRVKLNIESVTKSKSDSEIKKIILRYEINISPGQEMSLNYIYIKLPKDIKGDPVGYTLLGELISEKAGKGKHSILNNPVLIQHSFTNNVEINNQEVLQHMGKNKKIEKFRIIANTSRYGNVRSNKAEICGKNVVIFYE